MSNPVPRLRRLLSIIPMIQRRGEVGLDELQRTLGVSKRELQGDLNAIMLCGVPPYLPNDYISVFVDGDRVTIDYAEHFSRPARLTLQEALALRLAIARLQVPEDGPLYEAAQELLAALDRMMLGADFASLEGRIETDAQDARASLGLIDQAVAQRRALCFTYYSPSSERITRRTVLPYGRGDRLGNQYLIGHCQDRGEVRTFRVDRVSELELQDAPPFELPEGFDLEAHLAAIGPRPGEGAQLRVRFVEAIAGYETEDAPDRDVEHLPNGDVVISRSCGSVEYAVNDCLHSGELAEVLEPAAAREQLKARLRAFLAGE
ncbi:MAG: helix-turn-helix transcriptional regulator [Planctomycetota bacterium]